jgi:hypothetical protein
LLVELGQRPHVERVGQQVEGRLLHHDAVMSIARSSGST